MTFKERMQEATDKGMRSGLFAQDPIVCAMWYHAGQADMAREFASGTGATLAKLDAIEAAIKDCASVMRTQQLLNSRGK